MPKPVREDLQAPQLVAEGVIDPDDCWLFWYAETADESREDIERW